MVDSTIETITCPATESSGDLKQRNIISNGNGTTHKPSNGHVQTKVRLQFFFIVVVYILCIPYGGCGSLDLAKAIAIEFYVMVRFFDFKQNSFI